MIVAVICQIILLVYHQVTTLVDLYPFNGARHYTRRERWAEADINIVLMSLAPIGFMRHIRGLMIYGVVYYFVLFSIELIIWWVPYFFTPRGKVRMVYNLALAIGTSNFGKGDALDRWLAIHQRIHHGTISFLPARAGRIRPNLEHMLLHAWTLFTAVITLKGVYV
jgi:hypothetical protein